MVFIGFTPAKISGDLYSRTVYSYQKSIRRRRRQVVRKNVCEERFCNKRIQLFVSNLDGRAKYSLSHRFDRRRRWWWWRPKELEKQRYFKEIESAIGILHFGLGNEMLPPKRFDKQRYFKDIEWDSCPLDITGGGC